MGRRLFKHLTNTNKDSFFRGSFYEDEPCTYDEDYFLFRDVVKIAEQNNVEVIYISKQEDEVLYKMTHCFGFFVRRLITENLEQNNEDKTFLFDPEQLVC